MGQGSGHGHRMTCAERLELQRRVRAGETYQTAAEAVGCSSKSVQRLLGKTGGLRPRTSMLRDRDRVCARGAVFRFAVTEPAAARRSGRRAPLQDTLPAVPGRNAPGRGSEQAAADQYGGEGP